MTISIRLPRALELADIEKISKAIFHRHVRSFQFSRRDVSIEAVLQEGESVAFRMDELRDAVLELYDGLRTRVTMIDDEVFIGRLSQ